MKGISSPHQITTRFLRDVFERQNSPLLASYSGMLSRVLHLLLQVRSQSDYLLFKEFLSLVPTGESDGVEQFINAIIQKKGLQYTSIDAHHIGSDGPGIAVANHPIGLIDGILLFDLLRTQGQKVAVIGSSKASFLDPSYEHLIPIHHTKDLVDLYARVEAKVRDGYVVLIFPAGDVTYFRPEENTFSEKKRRRTPVLWSSAFDVPVYPVHIGVDIPQEHNPMFLESRSKLTSLKVNLRAALESNFLNNFTLTCRAPVRLEGCTYTSPGIPDDPAYAEQMATWLEEYTKLV